MIENNGTCKSPANVFLEKIHIKDTYNIKPCDLPQLITDVALVYTFSSMIEIC